jgi:RHS repeat-associated protein
MNRAAPMRITRSLFCAGLAALVPAAAIAGLAGCSTAATSTGSSQVRATSRIAYYHPALGAGPTVITGADGALVDERRFEPFGAAIGAIDYGLDPHNLLNKESDVHTGWSDHGARWLAPETARWLTPDPPLKAPDPELLSRPEGLHPYQYVSQNPIQFWDPDGKDAYRLEWKEDQARLAAEHQQRMAAAVAAIGGARPGITPPPARNTPTPKVLAALDWNSRCTETLAAVADPLIASRLDGLQDEARDASKRFGLTELNTTRNHNNAVDAFRHAYFTYRLTQVEDAATAKRWGDAHEVSVPSEAAERVMDLWNNAVGRELATRHGDADAYDTIYGAYRAGLLMTQQGTGGTAPAEKRPYELPIVRDFAPAGKFR